MTGEGKPAKAFIANLLQETLVVSAAYVALFILTYEILHPAQGILISNVDLHASLLFFPHGVRILAAWLLGWRAVVALAPGAWIMHVYLFGDAAYDSTGVMGVLVGITVCPLAFHLFKFAGWDLFPKAEMSPSFPGIMAVGLFASILNALLFNFIFGSSPPEYVAYIVGDFFGVFFLLLTCLLVARRFTAFRDSN